MPAIVPVLWIATLLPAQAAGEGDAAKKAAAERLAALKAQAARYQFRAGKEGTTLHPEPLLRWTNPVAQEEDAVLFLWVRGGRPEATAQFFVRGDVWMHEFASLSESPFVVDWAGGPVWSPNGPGAKFRPVPRGPAPAKSAAQRLNQMRSIAESFRASVEFRYEGESRYELRLLTRPLHRYGPADGPIQDGALWAFVQGTNPEVLLLIEARKSADGQTAWHYALAPMTSYAAEVRRGGEIVWSIERREVPTKDATGPYFFRYRVPVEQDRGR